MRNSITYRELRFPDKTIDNHKDFNKCNPKCENLCFFFDIHLNQQTDWINDILASSNLEFDKNDQIKSSKTA